MPVLSGNVFYLELAIPVMRVDSTNEQSLFVGFVSGTVVSEAGARWGYIRRSHFTVRTALLREYYCVNYVPYEPFLGVNWQYSVCNDMKLAPASRDCVLLCTKYRVKFPVL